MVTVMMQTYKLLG